MVVMVLKLEIAVDKFLCKVLRNKKLNLSSSIDCFSFLKKKKVHMFYFLSLWRKKPARDIA